MSGFAYPVSGPVAVRPNHVFVDAVRFWSMFAVVALHSAACFTLFRPEIAAISLPLESLCKFGTIGFFLISGFLLGERIETSEPITYLSRRLKNLLIPWSFWFSLVVLYFLASDISHHRFDLTSAASWLHQVFSDIEQSAFRTSFWFVPNLAFGMCILLLFRRYLDSVLFGAALFAINFIYIANIYGQWFPSTHTQAIFGFVSYLWLGSYVARNFSRFNRLMDRVGVTTMFFLCLLGYLASIGEAFLLHALHSEDPTNTLRASNQIFSVLVVLFLFKLKTRSWPAFVHVREQTFGIYLMHYLFLRIISTILTTVVVPDLFAGRAVSTPVALTFCVVIFVFSYGSSMLTASWLAHQNGLRWTIGLKPERVSKVHGAAVAI